MSWNLRFLLHGSGRWEQQQALPRGEAVQRIKWENLGECGAWQEARGRVTATLGFTQRAGGGKEVAASCGSMCGNLLC